MKWALLLEPEDKIYEELVNFLNEIDPELAIVRFNDVPELSGWIQETFISENKSDVAHPVEGDSISLAVLSSENLGTRKIELVKKMSQFFMSRNFLADGVSQLPVLLTAFESEHNFELQKYQSQFFTNVLFKPFDKIVCQAKIRFALYGLAALRSIEIYKEVPFQLVEMRKDIQVLRLSELGFTSLSPRAISKGEIGIYNQIFPIEKLHEPIYGICVQSKESLSLPGSYLCQIDFLAPDFEFSSKLSNFLATNGKDEEIPTSTDHSFHNRTKITILSPKKQTQNAYQELAEKDFTNLDIECFDSVDDFNAAYDANASAQLTINKMTAVSALQQISFEYDEKFEKISPIEALPEGQTVFGFGKAILSNFKEEILLHCNEFDRAWLTNFLNHDDADSRTYFFPWFFQGVNGFLCLEKLSIEPGQTSKRMVLRIPNVAEISKSLATVHQAPVLPAAIFISDHLQMALIETFPQQGVPYKVFKTIPLFSIRSKNTFNHEIHENLSAYKGYVAEVSHGRSICLYLAKHFPQLQLKAKERKLRVLAKQFVAQCGVRVSLNSISETHLTLKYSRPIAEGRFRYFKLLEQKTKEEHFVLARCIGSESDPADAKRFLSHFVLYSTSNKDLTFVRKWLSEQYRLAKTLEGNS